MICAAHLSRTSRISWEPFLLKTAMSEVGSLTGITGSLSTVSTFVNEIDGLGAQVDELVLHGRQVGCP